jgi:hypothetical protein
MATALLRLTLLFWAATVGLPAAVPQAAPIALHGQFTCLAHAVVPLQSYHAAPIACGKD